MGENQELLAHFGSITDFFDLIGISRILLKVQIFRIIFRY